MKQQLLDQLNKIKDLFQENCKKIISLIESYQVNENQVIQITKSLNRIQKFLELNQSPNKHHKQTVTIKQEPFNDNDFTKIDNYTSTKYSTKFDVKQIVDELWHQQGDIAKQIEVDEKTDSFDKDGYYGYKMNGIPNGIGIKAKKDQLIFGFFMGGEISHIYFSLRLVNRPRIHNVGDQIFLRVNKFFEIYPNLIKYRTFEDTDQIVERFEKELIKLANRTECVLAILFHYIGLAKNISEYVSHKHGYGLYLDLELPTFALGLWQDNKFIDGLLISKEGNNYFNHSGQMGDHHQQFIKH